MDQYLGWQYIISKSSCAVYGDIPTIIMPGQGWQPHPVHTVTPIFSKHKVVLNQELCITYYFAMDKVIQTKLLP